MGEIGPLSIRYRYLDLQWVIRCFPGRPRSRRVWASAGPTRDASCRTSVLGPAAFDVQRLGPGSRFGQLCGPAVRLGSGTASRSQASIARGLTARPCVPLADVL
jgi:hypothetical protein